MASYALNLTAPFLAAVVGLAAPSFLRAQDNASGRPAGSMTALEALDANYRKQLHELECRRIADLADLAAKSTGPQADAAYRSLFSLATARNLCPQAQDAAQRGDAQPKPDRIRAHLSVAI